MLGDKNKYFITTNSVVFWGFDSENQTALMHTEGYCMLDMYIYLVCGNTMYVSTCQIEFVFRELSFLLLELLHL